jgi:hypothetical protein
MHKERLLRLADKLEGKGAYEKDGPVPEHKFDIDNWVTGPGYTPLDCGTAGCAIGWALTEPWFNEEGLNLDGDSTAPVYGGLDGWNAVQAFFGLHSGDAQGLFNQAWNVTEKPTEVANLIREFVAEAT